MELFLILVTKHEPPVSRSLRLFAFAFWNPEHTPIIERVYTDIIKTQCHGQSTLLVDQALEEYLALGDDLGPGAEAVVFRALLDYHCSSPELNPGDSCGADVNSSMRAVRRLLLAILEPVINPDSLVNDPEAIQEYFDRAENLVRVCGDIPILDILHKATPRRRIADYFGLFGSRGVASVRYFEYHSGVIAHQHVLLYGIVEED